MSLRWAATSVVGRRTVTAKGDSTSKRPPSNAGRQSGGIRMLWMLRAGADDHELLAAQQQAEALPFHRSLEASNHGHTGRRAWPSQGRRPFKMRSPGQRLEQKSAVSGSSSRSSCLST